MKFKKMKHCPFLFGLLVMLGITPLSHAEIQKNNPLAEEVKQETQDFLQTLKAYTAEPRDEAAQKTKTALDNLDKEIEVLQTRIDNKWETMDTAAREKRVRGCRNFTNCALTLPSGTAV
jgi:dsDNA-specific endonuclease/ATPase MutS2